MKWFQKTAAMTLFVSTVSSSHLFAEADASDIEKVEKTSEKVKPAIEEMASSAEKAEVAVEQVEAKAAEIVPAEKKGSVEEKSKPLEKGAENPIKAAETAEVKDAPSETKDAPIEEEPREEKPLSEKEAEAAEEAKDKKNEEEKAVEQVERQVLGWKEWIKIGTKADVMRAKLDSGARTSSLHAEGIEEFERDGRRWVRFSMSDPDAPDAKSILVKAPVERVAKVKNTDGTMERRYVVELGFTMGERKLREEFNLNDRTGMICPVLLGRNALRHLGYVDCSRVDLASKNILK